MSPPYIPQSEEFLPRYQQLKVDSGQLTVVVSPTDWIGSLPPSC